MADNNFSRHIVERAEQELARRRIQAEETREKARQEVYAKVPEIKAIDLEIRTSGISMIQAMANGLSDKKKQAEFKNNINELIKRKKELLKENGFPPKILDIKYKCATCRDTGERDGEYCKCRTDIIRRLTIEESGLSRSRFYSFDEFNLEFYSNEVSERGVSARQNATKILEVCLQYTQGNLFFYGGTGLGKTFLSCCIAGKMLEEGKIVCYISAPKLFSILNDERFSKSQSEEVKRKVEMIYTADYLVIDDLGTEFQSSFTESCLFDILNTRLEEGRNTIINSNISLDALKDNYSERITSRIAGEYKLLRLFGEDIRRVKRKTDKKCK
ncbi:MAG: ATP-binding protein [Eubacteriales bacterium]|nr:ATP-binding protein [Eubacteriales bacterium]